MHAIRFYSSVHPPRVSTTRYIDHAEAEAELGRINRLSQMAVRAEVVYVALDHTIHVCTPNPAAGCGARS